MKKVVKVSIGNIAFTIEEDGYLVLKGYLEELNDHYRAKQNGNEIIEGIEERMSELFIEKAGKDAMVTLPVVKEVIGILGRPDDIDQEADSATGSYSSASAQQSSAPKRVYRDPDHKMIGGVCSGLASYFNIDIAIVRIIFLVLLFFSAIPHLIIPPFVNLHFFGGSFITIVYIILWIAIPEAKTMEQKFAMRGQKPDLSNIQRNVENGMNNMGRNIRSAGRNSAPVLNDFFRVIVKIIAIFFIIFSVSGILMLSFMFLGAEIFKGFIPLDILDYVQLGINSTIWLKISALAFFFLPLIGMLYGGIQMLFDFKKSKFRPGLIIVILWIISGFAAATLSVKAARPYFQQGREVSDVPMLSKSDTIYIKLASATAMPQTKVMMEGDESDMTLFWVDESGADRKFVAFPKVRIVRQSGDEARFLNLRTQAFAYTSGEAMIKAQKNLPAFELTDSLLTIHPDVYNKTNKWDGTNKTIALYIPDSVKVIVQEPLKFAFDTNMRIHSGWDWCWGNEDDWNMNHRRNWNWNRGWYHDSDND